MGTWQEQQLAGVIGGVKGRVSPFSAGAQRHRTVEGWRGHAGEEFRPLSEKQDSRVDDRRPQDVLFQEAIAKEVNA